MSVAARERMRGSLQASLTRLSQEVSSELVSVVAPLVPAGRQADEKDLEAQVEDRFHQWQSAGKHTGLIKEIAVLVPRQQTVELRNLDFTSGKFSTGEWPAEWRETKKKYESMLAFMSGQDRDGGRGRGPDRGQDPGRDRGQDGGPGHGQDAGPSPMGPPSDSGMPGNTAATDAFSVEVPIFSINAGPFGPGPGPGPSPRREVAWMLFTLDPQYIRDSLLPEEIRKYLETGGESDYEVVVRQRAAPQSIIYESDPGHAASVEKAADGSTALFDLPRDMFQRNQGGPGQARGGRGPSQAPGSSSGFGGRGPSPDSGRWLMVVRHRAGSLEAVVARTRRANLGVTAVVLLLMMGSALALMRFTRRAQHLAQVQMDFVAGVSHELRTPLTVIHTAAYNLQGKLSTQPHQVERYGALIQKESARLKGLVEQILRFASAEAGRAIETPRPVAVEAVVDAALENSKSVLDSYGFRVDRHRQEGLPLVLADSVSLQQALSNVIGNAAKYGAQDGQDGTHWIGIATAAGVSDMVEIRIADHGPGIPKEELGQVFDPFFRGARAREAQIHGTGLGLALTRKIIEAHGGTISVKSELMKGTEFTMRIPAAPRETSPAETDSDGVVVDGGAPGGVQR